MVTVVSFVVVFIVVSLVAVCCFVVFLGEGGLIGWFRVSSSHYNATKSSPSIYSNFLFVLFINSFDFHTF